MSSTTAAAVAKLPRVPPSSFAALLRRSKFASYDPKIGQIYTTYDGSAHRGDWGLKRPLSVRRRDGRLIIKSIDTMYQQTEWTSAYSDATAVQKFKEMGVTPDIRRDGTYWGPQFGSSGELVAQPKWMHESDFSSYPQGAIEATLDSPYPDPRTMGPKRFERYLRKLRRLAPEFREFVEKENTDGSHGAKSKKPYHTLVADGYACNKFISEKFAEACTKDSMFIRPMPHPTAGLTYNNRHGELQTSIHAKPIPGRRLHILERSKGSNQPQVNVALGGWIANESVTVKQVINKNGDDKWRPIPTLDLDTSEGRPRRNLEEGIDAFRPTKVILYKPPQVVGKYPERLDQSIVSMKVMSWKGAGAARSNPHKPGTVDYIRHQEGQKIKKKKQSLYERRKDKGGNFTMTNPSRQYKGVGSIGAGSQNKENTSIISKLQIVVRENNREGGSTQS